MPTQPTWGVTSHWPVLGGRLFDSSDPEETSSFKTLVYETILCSNRILIPQALGL